MNKTISINPDLFSVTSHKRKSKKNKESQNGEIKIKNPTKNKEKHKKIRKQHILRFLREKQEENYKKLLEGDKNKVEKPIDTSFNNDFEESIKYFDDLSKKNNDTNKHNITLKNVRNENVNIFNDIEPLPKDIFSQSSNSTPITLSEPNIRNASTPSWGCLKNGNLPTFKDWKRSTQKSHNIDESKNTMDDKKMR